MLRNLVYFNFNKLKINTFDFTSNKFKGIHLLININEEKLDCCNEYTNRSHTLSIICPYKRSVACNLLTPNDADM